RRRRDDTLEDLQQVVDELGAAHRLAHAAAKALTLAHEWWARTDRAVGGISGGSAVMRSSAQLARSPMACADAARSQAWLEPTGRPPPEPLIGDHFGPHGPRRHTFLGSHITASLPLLYPTQYRVQHERVLRHPPAGAAPRHHRARVPAAAAHTGLRLRPARGAPAPRLRHRCEHAVPPAAAPREAGLPHQRVAHRGAPPPQVLLDVCRRRPPGRDPHRGMDRADQRDHVPVRRHPDCLSSPARSIAMNTALVERYITSTIRSLPQHIQDDVRAELTTSITDAIDARTEQGEDPETAERAVLTELGDPAVLAAEYVDRPLHLIGPRYFLTWWRLLKLLLTIGPAVAIAGVALAQLIAQEPIGAVIGESIAAGISAVVHVFFWVTLVFAILERSGADAGARWDVDQLPEPQSTG